jgi:hypothetical protein
VHPGSGKKHGRIVVRKQGLSLDLGVALRFEEFYVFGTEFAGCHSVIILGKRGGIVKMAGTGQDYYTNE